MVSFIGYAQILASPELAFQERRGSNRLKCRLMGYVQVHDGIESLECLLLNISHQGAAIIYHPESLGEYDPAGLAPISRTSLLVPGNRVFLEHFPARVIYRRPVQRHSPPMLGQGSCIQCGLCFEGLTRFQRNRLRLFLRHYADPARANQELL